MKRICVFAGSSPGRDARYRTSARSLGAVLAARGIGLVYGGGGTGLMGTLADSVLSGGGSVTGVIPGPLADRELAHRGLTELRIVGSMHERKATMAGLADGFIALPGGLGTLEEFLEVWTWAQLGIHAKPCGLLNAAGYYDPLMQFVDRMVDEEFVQPVYRGLVLVDSDPGRLVGRLIRYKAPPLKRWMEDSAT